MSSDVQCEVTGDRTVSDKLVTQFSARMRASANDLLHGTLSFEDWIDRMKDIIEISRVQQAQTGTPDADVRQISAKDTARINAGIVQEYEFLDGFASDIEAAIEEDGASLDFISNRAELYAKSSQAEYWRQAIGVEIPNVPGDGSTQCLGNCDCSVRTECEYDDDGNVTAVLVYWELGTTEKHCPDCPARAEEWNPLRIEV